MSLKDVMAPAIRIAEQGYTVSKTLNAMMKEISRISPNTRGRGCLPESGLPYEVGTTGPQGPGQELPDYRREGAGCFYKGEIADAIEKEMKASGKGLITKADLAAYKPAIRPGCAAPTADMRSSPCPHPARAGPT